MNSLMKIISFEKNTGTFPVMKTEVCKEELKIYPERSNYDYWYSKK